MAVGSGLIWLIMQLWNCWKNKAVVHSESRRRAVVLSSKGSSQAAWIEIHFSKGSRAYMEWNPNFRVLVHSWAARCNSEFAWGAELCRAWLWCQILPLRVSRVSAGDSEHPEMVPVCLCLQRAHAFAPCSALRAQHLLRNFLMLSVEFGSSHPLWFNVIMFWSGTFWALQTLTKRKV